MSANEKVSNSTRPPISVSEEDVQPPREKPIPSKKRRKTEPGVIIAPTAPGGPDVTIR